MMTNISLISNMNRILDHEQVILCDNKEVCQIYPAKTFYRWLLHYMLLH